MTPYIFYIKPPSWIEGKKSRALGCSIDQGLLIKCIRADDKIYFCRILYSYLFDLVKSAEFSDILSVILQTATSQVLHHCPYNRYRYVEADDFFFTNISPSGENL